MAYRSVLGKKIDKVVKGGISDDIMESISKDVEKFLKSPNLENRKLGEGKRGNVYKIDDYYVLKRPKVKIYNHVNYNIDSSLSKIRNYYGVSLFKIGDLSILKNVYTKGQAIPSGIPEWAKRNNFFDAIKRYNEITLPLFSNLPQRAYDELAKAFVDLNKIETKKGCGFKFDYNNPNNIVLAGKTLRMTDEVHPVINSKNSVSDMMSALLVQMDVDWPAMTNEKLIGVRRQIMKKIVVAGVKNNLPLVDAKLGDYTWSYVCSSLCKFKKNHKTIIDDLEKIKSISKTKDIVKNTESYIDELCKE